MNALTEAEKKALARRLSNEARDARIAGELSVLKMTAEVMIAKGFYVSLNDGEETTVVRSQDVAKLTAAAQTTDHDYLIIYRDESKESRMGQIMFVYGNSPCEVIADYSCDLEEHLKPVNKYCDTLA